MLDSAVLEVGSERLGFLAKKINVFETGSHFDLRLALNSPQSSCLGLRSAEITGLSSNSDGNIHHP